MNDREQYAPGPARGAPVRKEGEKGRLEDHFNGRAPAANRARWTHTAVSTG
jgi:hypothetical protein